MRGSVATTEWEPLQQLRCITDGPAVNGRVVDGNAPLGHHLLKITQAQTVAEIPPHDHRSVEMAPLNIQSTENVEGLLP